jgi:hypothetical protein
MLIDMSITSQYKAWKEKVKGNGCKIIIRIGSRAITSQYHLKNALNNPG